MTAGVVVLWVLGAVLMAMALNNELDGLDARFWVAVALWPVVIVLGAVAATVGAIADAVKARR